MPTITALFDSRADAETARDRLAAAGISRLRVSIHDKRVFDAAAPGAARSASPGYAMADVNDRGVSQGQPPEPRSDGSAGTHRGALGDFIDNRTGNPVGSDAGSERNAFGDFVDKNGERRGEEGHAHASHAHADHDDSDDDRGLWDRIKAFFNGDDEVYEEGMRRGGHVLTAQVNEADVERAIAILDDDGVVDLVERQGSWRNDGWTGGIDNSDRGVRVRSYVMTGRVI